MRLDVWDHSYRLTSRKPCLIPVQKQCISLLFLLLCLQSALSAHGLYRNGLDATTAGRAGIHTVEADTPISALSGNPAGLADQDNAVQLSMAAVLPSGHFSNNFNCNRPLEIEAALVPAFAASYAPEGSKLTFAFGVVPDVTLQAKWRLFDPGGGALLPAGNHDYFSEIVVVTLRGGLGWAVNDWLSVGATLGASYNTNKLDAPYRFQNPDVAALRGVGVLLDLETSGWGFSGSVGALADVSDSVALAITYVTPTWLYTEGSANVSNGTATYEASLDQQLPQRLSGGIRWQVDPQLALLGQVDWIHYGDAFDQLTIELRNGTGPTPPNFDERTPLDWKDAVVWRVAAVYDLSDTLQTSVGYTYGNNTVANATLTPMTAAINEQALTAGLRYRMGDYQFGLAYQYDIANTASSGQSSLADGGSGAYDNQRIRFAAHWVTTGLTWYY